MRKALIATVGQMVLLLSAYSGFTFDPVISSIPDIIVSDYESNRTSPQNFFVFSDALNLDEYVRDDDTTKRLLRWSFVETAPQNSILISGIGSLTAPTPANIKNPGAFNLRAAGPWVSIRNNQWSPRTQSPPYPAPGAAGTSTVSIIQMYVSDGTSYTSQFLDVVTYHTASPPRARDLRDYVDPQPLKSWTFESGPENWTWFDYGGGAGSYIHPPDGHQAADGRLEISLNPDGGRWRPIVFGAWESPLNPTVPGALRVRSGCVMRARVRMTSSAPARAMCPGFRFRAWWTPVVFDPTLGRYVPDFSNPDFNDQYEMHIKTFNALYIDGRDPGTAGKTYTVLYYPQQIDTLMTTAAIVRFTCDMLDEDDFNDWGQLNIEQVDVDSFDRPEIGAPGMNSVPQLSFTNFATGWERFALTVGAWASTATVTASASVGGLAISCAPGTTGWEYGFVTESGVRLAEGRYYRANFRAYSSAGGRFAPPTLRTSFISQRVVAFCHKQMEGGGLYSNLAATGTDFEMWYAAPTNIPGTSQTEPFNLRFEAYLLYQPDGRGKDLAGAVGCTRLDTEWMRAPP